MPKAYHHGDLRRSLIEEAAELIEEVGLENVTLKALATRAEVSHTAPYRHFRDLSELFRSVGDAGIAMLAQAMRRAYKRAGTDAEAQLLAVGWSVVRFSIQKPGYFRVMFGPGRPQTVAELRQAGPDTAMGVLLDYLADWQRRGLFRKGDPMELALSCWVVVHGLGTLVSSGRLQIGQTQARKLSDATLRGLLDGLRPKS
ncbi:MAG: TetR/AcrR family transcriptional regulator [Myxococcota bacterium]